MMLFLIIIIIMECVYKKTLDFPFIHEKSEIHKAVGNIIIKLINWG